jgi:poly(A) polymerase
MNLELLHKTGLLFSIFPELKGLEDVEQDKRWHPEGNVLIHTKLVCENVPKGDIVLLLAALFHDVGKKTTTVVQDDGRITARGHEKVSVEITEPILDRLKVSNDVKHDVLFIIENHMKAHSPSTKKKTLRKMINKGGLELVQKLMVFSRADVTSASKHFDEVDRLDRLLQEIVDSPAPVVVKPVLNGHEVMELTGLQGGKELGIVISKLIDFQMDNDNLVDKDQAREFIKNLV